jgi:hypothetical protein
VSTASHNDNDYEETAAGVEDEGYQDVVDKKSSTIAEFMSTPGMILGDHFEDITTTTTSAVAVTTIQEEKEDNDNEVEQVIHLKDLVVAVASEESAEEEYDSDSG